MVCSNCGLGQISHDVNQKILFEDYRYTSSTSQTMLYHASQYAKHISNIVAFTEQDYVLEIACNDGYLLKFFAENGIKCLGIDPARNIIEKISQPNIQLINDFFTEQIAYKIVRKFGYPKLVVANNVLAHVPNIVDFMSGIKVLCGPKTLVTIENPSLKTLKNEILFDTVYHEHYSYISANSVKHLAEMNDLNIVSIENLNIHGGSNRYYLSLTNDWNLPFNSNEEILSEIDSGLMDSESWSIFREDVLDKVKSVEKWFQIHGGNKTVGFGAAAKASTLLNLLSINTERMPFIGDNSDEKIGRFLPMGFQRIISKNDLVSYAPENIVIFPWNIADEIKTSLVQNGLGNVKFWKLLPEVEQL